MAPYRVTLRIDQLPQLNAADNINPWMKGRQRRRWAWLLRAALGRQPRPPGGPLERARVTFTRCSSAPRPPDDDNLPNGFKMLRDLLQDPKKYKDGLGLIRDDGPGCLVEAVYQWKPAPRRKGFVEIVVEEA